MMIVRLASLAFIGLSAGVLVAGGVFTTLIALGLVPRFAGRTHTAGKAILYENGIISGCWFAILFGLWNPVAPFLQSLADKFPGIIRAGMSVGGFFAGCFVGCMALAIAEMLDGISIFARRLSFRQGIGIALFGFAIGKVIGSVYYFVIGMGE